MDGELLSRREAATFLRMQASTLANMSSQGRGPKTMTPKGASRALYEKSELLRWVREGDRAT